MVTDAGAGTASHSTASPAMTATNATSPPRPLAHRARNRIGSSTSYFDSVARPIDAAYTASERAHPSRPVRSGESRTRIGQCHRYTL